MDAPNQPSRPAVHAPTPQRQAVNAWSPEYLEAQYQRWRSDSAAVAPDLASFFQGFDLGRAAPGGPAGAPAAVTSQAPAFDHATGDALAVANLCRHYREYGHLCAALDPFGRERPCPDLLTPQKHGLGEAHLSRTYGEAVHGIAGLGDAALRDIIDALDETYCCAVGVEYTHVPDPVERQWLQQRIESSRLRANLSRGERVHVLYQLHRAEMFETFLQKRYLGQKRFSLEGGDSLIPLLDWIIQKSPALDVRELVMGMAHRGRLNVLANVLGKTYEQIFTEFEANWDESFVEGGGDVKYHLGYSGDRKTVDGKDIRVVLSSNPSHLESVNGVVLGRTRAKQRLHGDTTRDHVVPVLIHGDAAFIAQGVVLEALNMSRLEGYAVGGALHVVINNLIGFTTGPEDGRSSEYCSDAMKTIGAPVLHVNGEDPESVVAVAEIALEYRQKFKKDVCIDMWCYRKWGHNEGDDPSFTQPVMAGLIKRKPGVLHTYAERLLAEGVIAEKDVQEIRRALDEQMEKAQSSAHKMGVDPVIDPGSWRWKGFDSAFSFDPVETGVPRAALEEVGRALSHAPEGFRVHKNLAKQLEQRTASVLEDGPLDWGTCEALALGTLLLDGVPVRLSGQDSRRGTFSHRHAVLRDTETGEPYVPLGNMRTVGDLGAKGTEPGAPGPDGRTRQAPFYVYDSPLSEYAVLGFEFGYALADPRMLVLWEAQFGDFANTAQVIIDQYIASAEIKWERWNGLVLLLPHGYEGQGPEHSSARLERFLSLCADENIQVTHPTTPAQFFHLLRRQLKRTFRKPLVVLTPKSLLRLPEAASRVGELTSGTFREVIDDPRYEAGADRKGVKRVILCSGKVYYDLARRREEAQRNDVAIIRVEQLYPLHSDLLMEVVGRYPAKAERVWCQEEPRNAGAYIWFDDACRSLLGWDPLPYIGRPASATPATGSKKRSDAQMEAYLQDAIGPARPGAGASPKKEKVAAH